MPQEPGSCGGDGRGLMHKIVGHEEVQRLMRDGAQIVEVLPREEYAEGHLPGAINIPLKELDAKTASSLRRDRAVVVYCDDFQ
ncbi:MAG TPA: hypothetical protein DCK98_04765 [Chloroflexi bacterium]|jgi:rhodanese-related sulfurtransferase|nr:hypothetical protein [Chloroflexota bacterium]